MIKKFAGFIAFCLLFVLGAAGCSLMVGSTNLQKETLAGVCIDQAADIPALVRELGPLTVTQTIEKGGRALTFDNPPKYAYIVTDADNRVTQITVGYPSRTGNTEFKTGRGIGSQSSFTDVTQVYGNAYSKETYRDFMGSGDGYSVRYFDWERHTLLEFGFVEDGDNGEFLSNIMMKML